MYVPAAVNVVASKMKKPAHNQPIYYTDGIDFYRKYRRLRTRRDENGKWVEIPCYEKPTYWEIPASDVDDPEFPEVEVFEQQD